MKCFRRAGPVLVFVLLTGTAMGASLPGIQGSDDRMLVDGADGPWSAIGRINRQGGGFCTGVAIGRRTVLTAAHCLWNSRTRRWGGAQTIHFLPGYKRGDYLQHGRVASYEVGSTAETSARGPADDWAILTLSTDLDSRVEPLELEPLNSHAGRHLQVGYSQDKPHMLTVDRTCRISAAAEGLLVHDCDATRGSSGSPLLSRRTDGRYVVVGLHIGSRRDGASGVGISAAEIVSRRTGEKTQ